MWPFFLHIRRVSSTVYPLGHSESSMLPTSLKFPQNSIIVSDGLVCVRSRLSLCTGLRHEPVPERCPRLHCQPQHSNVGVQQCPWALPLLGVVLSTTQQLLRIRLRLPFESVTTRPPPDGGPSPLCHDDIPLRIQYPSLIF